MPWDEWVEGIKAIITEKDPDLWAEYETGKRIISETTNEFIKKFGIEAKEKMNAFTEKFEINRLQGIRPNTELIEFIKENKDGYEMYVWSSNSEKVIKKVLKEVGLDNHFKTIVSRDHVAYLKPNPSGLRLSTTA